MPIHSSRDAHPRRSGEVSTVEALASYIAALGGKLELIADIGGHLVKMRPTRPPDARLR
jgi:hypothetical protein